MDISKSKFKKIKLNNCKFINQKSIQNIYINIKQFKWF